MKPLLETLSEILPKEKNVNSGEGLPFENSPEIYGNRRIVAYANGANAMLSDVKLLLPQIIEAVRGEMLKNHYCCKYQTYNTKDFCDNCTTIITKKNV
jgi:hypothetical protein